MCKAIGITGDAARHWASDCTEIAKHVAATKANIEKLKAAELVNAGIEDSERVKAIIQKKAVRLAKKMRMQEQGDEPALSYHVNEVTPASTVGLDPRFAVLDTGSRPHATGNPNMIVGGEHGLKTLVSGRVVMSITGETVNAKHCGGILGLDDQALFDPDFKATVISGPRIDKMQHLHMAKTGSTYYVTNRNTGIVFPFKLHERGLYLCDMQKALDGVQDDAFEEWDGEEPDDYTVVPEDGHQLGSNSGPDAESRLEDTAGAATTAQLSQPPLGGEPPELDDRAPTTTRSAAATAQEASTDIDNDGNNSSRANDNKTFGVVLEPDKGMHAAMPRNPQQSWFFFKMRKFLYTWDE